MKTKSRDMQMVIDVIGEEAAKKLIGEIGGITIYIPKPPQSALIDDVIRTLRVYHFDVKKTSNSLGVSQSYVYNILKKYRTSVEFGGTVYLAHIISAMIGIEGVVTADIRSLTITSSDGTVETVKTAATCVSGYFNFNHQDSIITIR
ncbi:MAG: hypothetical protein RRZ64_05470 [Rikenellaceae bacterium]